MTTSLITGAGHNFKSTGLVRNLNTLLRLGLMRTDLRSLRTHNLILSLTTLILTNSRGTTKRVHRTRNKINNIRTLATQTTHIMRIRTSIVKTSLSVSVVK